MKQIKLLLIIVLMGSAQIQLFSASADSSSSCYSNFEYFINYAVDYIGTPGIPIEFKNLSKGANLQYWWDFGDGTTSTNANPVHVFAIKPHIMIYPEPPISKVCLTIFNSNGNCKNIFCKEIYQYTDTVIPQTCNSWFDYKDITDSSSGKKYLMGLKTKKVQFYGHSDNDVLDWKWNFTYGDGSSEQNPVATIYSEWNDYYKKYGTEVTLTTIAKDGCSFSTKRFIEGAYDPNQCQISFTYRMNDSLNRGDSIMYRFYGETDKKVTKWLWNFGDGITSNEQNPVHFFPNYRLLNTYDSKCGSSKKCLVFRNVCLNITTKDGCQTSSCQEIIPGQNPPEPTNCLAKFNYSVMKSNPAIYIFNNVSQWSGGTVFWDFGDGTYSYEENPKHVFSNNYYPVIDSSSWEGPKDSLDKIQDFMIKPGLKAYTVCLYIYSSNKCNSSYCEIIYEKSDTTGITCNNLIKLTTSTILGNNSCNGTATAELVDSKGNVKMASTYNWSNGDIGSKANYLCTNVYYSVAITDYNGCISSGSFALYDNSSPWVYPGNWKYYGNDSGYVFSFDLKDNKYDVNWIFSDDGDTLKGTNISYKFKTMDNNWVDLLVKDNTGNIVYQERLLVDNQTTVGNLVSERNINIYPIPADKILNVEFKSTVDETIIDIIDLTGRTVIKAITAVGQPNTTLNIDNLNKGIYICRIRTGKEILFTTKIIKQ